METLPVLAELPEHHRLLERAVDHFRPDERVAALVIAGSVANGGTDFYSDVDLYIIAREESFGALFAERDLAAEAVGQPLLRFVPCYKSKKGDQQYVVTYSTLVKIEFHYYRPADMTPNVKWKNCLILKDADGRAAEIKAGSQEATPPAPTREMLLAMNQEFWTWAWYTFGKLMRGELWEAYAALDAARSLVLLPMLAWTSGYPHEGHRRLEVRATCQQERLKRTVAALEAESLYVALRAELELFAELRAVLFDRYALSYGTEAEDIITGEMERRWMAR